MQIFFVVVVVVVVVIVVVVVVILVVVVVVVVFIVVVVLYVCETWSLRLWEERKLRVFENMVLRRIFGTRRDEVISGGSVSRGIIAQHTKGYESRYVEC